MGVVLSPAPLGMAQVRQKVSKQVRKTGLCPQPVKGKGYAKQLKTFPLPYSGIPRAKQKFLIPSPDRLPPNTRRLASFHVMKARLIRKERKQNDHLTKSYGQHRTPENPYLC